MLNKIKPANNYVTGDIVEFSQGNSTILVEIVGCYYTPYKFPIHMFYIKNLDNDDVIKIKGKVLYKNSTLINGVTGTKREVLRKEKRRKKKKAISIWYQSKKVKVKK